MALGRIDFMSFALRRTVQFSVVLPADPANFLGTGPQPTKPPYKTLYLLHGIYGSDLDWIANTNIQRMAREHQIAVIMPAAENHFYIDSGALGAQYGEFMKELVDVTRRMFPLSDKREDTFIGGFSMGAYGAFMNSLRYSDIFGYCVCLSTAVVEKEESLTGLDPLTDPNFRRAVFGEGDYAANRKTNNAMLDYALAQGAELPKFYLSCGDKDPLFASNERLHQYLETKGVEHVWKPGEGMHNFDFWGKTMIDVLEWLPHGEKIILGDSGNVFAKN